jgi:hypothetical protein
MSTPKKTKDTRPLHGCYLAPQPMFTLVPNVSHARPGASRHARGRTGVDGDPTHGCAW